MDIFEFSEDTKLSDLIRFKAEAFLPFLRNQISVVSQPFDQVKAEVNALMAEFSCKDMRTMLDEWQPAPAEMAKCDPSLEEYNVMTFFACYGLLSVFINLVETAIRNAEGEP